MNLSFYIACKRQKCKYYREKLDGKPLFDKERNRLLNYMLGRMVVESAKVLRDSKKVRRLMTPGLFL